MSQKSLLRSEYMQQGPTSSRRWRIFFEHSPWIAEAGRCCKTVRRCAAIIRCDEDGGSMGAPAGASPGADQGASQISPNKTQTRGRPSPPKSSAEQDSVGHRPPVGRRNIRLSSASNNAYPSQVRLFPISSACAVIPKISISCADFERRLPKRRQGPRRSSRSGKSAGSLRCGSNQLMSGDARLSRCMDGSLDPCARYPRAAKPAADIAVRTGRNCPNPRSEPRYRPCRHQCGTAAPMAPLIGGRPVSDRGAMRLTFSVGK